MSPELEPPGFFKRIRLALVGGPKDLYDPKLHRHLALLPILAWVGLGADGLSSSSYGPEEAFRALGEHTYLAVALAGMTAFTVFVIAAGYSRMIEHFPQGGGGYFVATTLLGQNAGVVSGCALLVDYVLTITISLAAAGDALFSFVPLRFHNLTLPVDVLFLLGLTVLNIRGIKESVLVLTPIFVVFAATHAIAIVGGILGHAGEVGPVSRDIAAGFDDGLKTLGAGGMLLLFLHAYSLGGGTYTGIEAVSNGLPILREPRVHNGKRTMMLMAASLAITAAGLLLLYLLWHVRPQPGSTMNATLMRRMTEGIPGGAVFAFVTLLSEAALLVVAAQAGFVDGPRVLANMAGDSWMPRHFITLSERLTTQNGIILMGAAALAALLYTRGSVQQLVVLYSINVFLTFSLSMFGMLKRAVQAAPGSPRRGRDLALFGTAFVLCATILIVTVTEKFNEGGWLILVVTSLLVGFCFWVRSHYRTVYAKVQALYAQLEGLAKLPRKEAGPLDPRKPTAAVLVGSYGGLGIHTFMNVFRYFPGHYHNLVFLSVGVVDTGEFKGEGSVEKLRERTEHALEKYVELARGQGIPATYRFAVGTDVVDELEGLCLGVAKDFPLITFFAGKVVFQKETWYQPLLHNETAIALQKRLHWNGHVLVTLPAKVQ